ncbi:class I SAM-dependent RNA methyltransferase [Reinekea marinisedimentorum]|uniref:23S rRNA (Uracil1939-C5)-methyltransferase n=1 Tax=Reinekea marinisedimentorum TaxID=230495 RepID=A0A4R3I4W8_9GAMM|nr:methyltransferase domain-containing protein [Reinekea marinisedimentorum]TCS39815.1 23S rRNA (uracil1939-C5)-methyltransferase [Reinekea marinisedimentorum]
MRFRRNQPAKKPLPEPLELDILRFSHDGRGIAEKDGRIVMVAGALPGERVTARIDKANTKLWQGHAMTVHQPSEARTEPHCAHFRQCGGCQLQHMTLASQHEIKRTAVMDHFRRNGIELPEAPAMIESPPFAYRHRARLHVSGKGQIGFHNAQGNQVVPVQQCPVFTEQLAAAYEQLRTAAPLKGLTQLELVVDDSCKMGAVAVKGKPEALERFHRWVEQQGWVWNQPLSYAAGEKTVTAYPGDFTQVNRAANLKMLETGAQWLNLNTGDRLLDLFCGSGNVAYFLSHRVGSLVGLEASEAAIRQAKAVQNGDAHCQFEVADLFQVDVSGMTLVRDLNPNVVVLDPPRAGAENICRHISKLTGLDKILYISCDPATLARDINLLQQADWCLSKLALVDMFPQTKHVETIALLEKK